jgi:uncharacterized protein (TIGR00255 family)
MRSVNHRYSELHLKLPDRLRFAEADIRRLIADRIKRGKIDCMISYKKQPQTASLSINQAWLQQLLQATATIEAQLPQVQAFTALEVLAFPGVQQETDCDREQLQASIQQLVSQTLEQLLANRQREGQQLALLVAERCDKILQLADAAEQRMPQVLAQLRSKLTARVVELVAEPNFDRLEQELVLLTQKLDVAEELDRLQTHVIEVRRALDQPEPTGRRLDFLMQELNREANTLGSKSADKAMTQIAIDIKVLIEQMREQIQNIE